MEMKVEASKVVEDGVHIGIITDVEYRTEPYEYTDVVIEMADKVKVKAGYPSTISESTSLGRLLQRFKATLTVGEALDPNLILTGAHAEFQTTTITKDGKQYSNVLVESVKPAPESATVTPTPQTPAHVALMESKAAVLAAATPVPTLKVESTTTPAGA